MTSINKLCLQGVRSYSDAEPETIEFFRPLTIIVGSNGSGKTTIIEALRYITTGSQPPLSDGGKSFIHDPKLSGQTSTKAQIRLSFRTDNERKAVLAIRSAQLTQNKTTRTYKALESVLRIKDLVSGKESSISHRCADMEKLVPQLMGVSAAVLDHVIFCHQDESFWPLGDSKSLKTKFDDIFASTRYTKALEAITKIRKEKNVQVKVMEADTRTIQAHMDNAHAKDDELKQLRQAMEDKSARIKAYDDEVKEIEVRLSKLSAHNADCQKLGEAIIGAEAALKAMIEEQKRVYDRMTSTLQNTEDELNDMLSDHDQRAAAMEKELQRMQDELKRNSAEVAASEQKHHDLIKLLGSYESQQKDQARRRTELQSMRNTLVSRYEIDSAEDRRIDQRDFAGVLKLFQSVMKRKSDDLEAHKVSVAKSDSSFELSISALKTRETKLNEQKQQKRASAKLTGTRMQSIVTNDEAAKAQLGSFADIAAQLASCESALAAFESNDRSEEIKAKIVERQRWMNQNSAQLLVLQAEKKSMGNVNEVMINMKMKQTHVDALRKRYNDHISAIVEHINKCHLSNAIRSTPRPLTTNTNELLAVMEPSSSQYKGLRAEEFDVQCRQYITSARQRMTEAESAVADVKARLTALQQQIRQSDDASRLLEPKLAQCKQQLIDGGLSDILRAELPSSLHSGKSSYDMLLDEAHSKLEAANWAKSQSVIAPRFIEKYISVAKESKLCALCSRGLSPSELAAFLALNEPKVTAMDSDSAQKARDTYTRAKEELRKLTNLKQVYHDYDRLTRERQTNKDKVDALKKDEAAQKQEMDATRTSVGHGEAR